MEGKGHLMMLDTNLLRPHPDNPRKDLGDLDELAESIKKNGVMQNLTAVLNDDGTCTVLIGHRRLAAAIKAGVREVPVKVVEDIDLKDQIAIMLEENMQRSDLTVIEEADSFQMMLDLGDSVNDIVRKTGFSKPTVKHRCELAKLDHDKLKAAVYDYSMNLTDLIALERVDDVEARNSILGAATSKWQIVNSVNIYVRDKNRAKVFTKIKPLLDELGAKEHKSFASWSSDYETLQKIDLDDPPDNIEINVPKGAGKLLYCQDRYDSGYLYIFKRAEKEKEDELKKLEREKEAKAVSEIDAVKSRLFDEMESFIVKVVDGTFKISGSRERDAWRKLWPFIIKAGDWYTRSFDIDNFCKQHFDRSSLSEIEEAIIYAFVYVRTRSPRDYGRLFNKNGAEEIIDFMNFLGDLGFDLNDLEIEQMLDGSLKWYGKV